MNLLGNVRQTQRHMNYFDNSASRQRGCHRRIIKGSGHTRTVCKSMPRNALPFGSGKRNVRDHTMASRCQDILNAADIYSKA